MRLVIDCFKLIKGVGKSIGIYNVAKIIVGSLGAQNAAKSGTTSAVGSVASNSVGSVAETIAAIDEGKHPDKIFVLGNSRNRTDFDVPGVEFIQIDKYDPENKIDIVMWELFHVANCCRKLKADRVFFPRGYAALTHPVYDIVMIHDLIPFYYAEHFPGVFNRLENFYITNRLRQSARTAKKVITISEASKQDIMKYCGVDEKKIKVINNSYEKSDVPIVKDEDQKPYICAMTSALPHKNAEGIIETYKRYSEITDAPLDLVLIGLNDVSEFDLPSEVKDRITCHKFIGDTAEMYRVMGGARAFLFLSLIEGFGLPPIEAMQLGVPVICSGVSSLPEVCGDAALLVDPKDPDEAAQNLKDLLSDDELRSTLIKRGYENVKRFSSESRAAKYRKEIME
ncbi:MAG: glycosyltransferase family 4 protein [Lachnospiraceae bacterium]|nr:glycosyltransferase family 4 protein [Lachnospiraceae bacterium]